MRYPSEKTLANAFPGYDPKVIRLLMMDDEMTQYYWEQKFPVSFRNTFYNRPPLQLIRMMCLDHYLETFGVEYICAGNNESSPAIEYLNAGDTYATTLMFVNGRFRVGCWGDIVESGNYD